MTERLEDLLAEACDLAEQAGLLTLNWFGQSGLEVESKNDGTEVQLPIEQQSDLSENSLKADIPITQFEERKRAESLIQTN